MKRNLVPLLGIAFVVAIVSTGIFYGLFAGRLRSGSSAPVHSIVVAAKKLERGAIIGAADVKLTPWGAAELPQGAYGAINQVTGLAILAPVEENEAIVQARVVSKQSGAGSALGVAPGMRAISIRATDSSGVVSMLRPGHKVDVQLVAPNQVSGFDLRTILQNIEVLSVSQAGDGRGATPVITLLMSPQGADMAGLGDSTARLRLTLRHPLDEGTPRLDRVTIPQIMQPTAPRAKK